MNNKLYYTGIGSRKTPKEVILAFNSIASYLAKQNFILRSGGADGADSAFEYGCDLSKGNKEIYLPFKGFNKNSSSLYNLPNSNEAAEIAKQIHPAWSKCSKFAKDAHTRNVFQVLGADLNTPTEFVLCWTENGDAKGGTATAINLAIKNNVPVFNAGSYKTVLEFKQAVWTFLKEKYNL